MTATAIQLARTTLTASSATLYTVPASTSVIVTNIVLANNSAIDRTVIISFGSVVVIPTMKVSANSIAAIDLRQVLAAGDTITGNADLTSVIGCLISGVGVV